MRHHIVQHLPHPRRSKNLPRIHIESDVAQALKRDILESRVYRRHLGKFLKTIEKEIYLIEEDIPLA